MRSFADALQSIAATLWVGALWAVGFVVAPVLFATLTDRALAGQLAGKLFGLMAWIGIGCAVYLIIYRLARFGASAFRRGVLWIVLLMLAWCFQRALCHSKHTGCSAGDTAGAR